MKFECKDMGTDCDYVANTGTSTHDVGVESNTIKFGHGYTPFCFDYISCLFSQSCKHHKRLC
jgi:hypothetical protein